MSRLSGWKRLGILSNIIWVIFVLGMAIEQKGKLEERESSGFLFTVMQKEDSKAIVTEEHFSSLETLKLAQDAPEPTANTFSNPELVQRFLDQKVPPEKIRAALGSRLELSEINSLMLSVLQPKIEGMLARGVPRTTIDKALVNRGVIEAGTSSAPVEEVPKEIYERKMQLVKGDEKNKVDEMKSLPIYHIKNIVVWIIVPILSFWIIFLCIGWVIDGFRGGRKERANT